MNQIKTGKFIAECRKSKNLTQVQLAEKLGITDRAVSKWETGKCLPDASIMLELCAELEINVNELLSGERINMNSYDKKAEENLLELQRQKENSDKNMLKLEIIIGCISTISFFILIFVAAFIEMDSMVRILLIVLGSIIFAIGIANAIKIEQIAGYYECDKCHHKYVPTYSSVLWAMHINRTRYMKCPHCHKRSWQKKVISK